MYCVHTWGVSCQTAWLDCNSWKIFVVLSQPGRSVCSLLNHKIPSSDYLFHSRAPPSSSVPTSIRTDPKTLSKWRQITMNHCQIRKRCVICHPFFDIPINDSLKWYISGANCDRLHFACSSWWIPWSGQW